MPKSKGRRKPRRTAQQAIQQSQVKVSPKWYSVVMFSLMAIGVAVVALNWIGVYPGGEKGVYSLIGLGILAAGFVMVMAYKSGETSPKWYAAMMFTLMAIGVVVIILNYIDLVPGGHRSIFLYSGLGSIAAGFLMTMNYQ